MRETVPLTRLYAPDEPNNTRPKRFLNRAHHRELLGIEGNADQPGGVVFTDARGRVIEPAGRPVPPGGAPAPAARRLGIATDGWRHPSGERLDPAWVYFSQTG